MCLENAKDALRSVLLLGFAAVVYWIDFASGPVLAAVMGAMILQSAFTDWCPADWLLRPMGMKSKLQQ